MQSGASRKWVRFWGYVFGVFRVSPLKAGTFFLIFRKLSFSIPKSVEKSLQTLTTFEPQLCTWSRPHTPLMFLASHTRRHLHNREIVFMSIVLLSRRCISRKAVLSVRVLGDYAIYRSVIAFIFSLWSRYKVWLSTQARFHWTWNSLVGTQADKKCAHVSNHSFLLK